LMKKLVADMDDDGSKTAQRILGVVKGNNSSMHARIYNFGFFVCEILNLAVVAISISILNALLNGEFSSYGTNVQTYMSFEKNPNLPELESPANPMCHLFPTEVSCNVKSGGITGGANKNNILCLLPNNVFYQYFFLILWWWYMITISVSCLGIVYRLVQIFLPQLGRMRLNVMWNAMGVPLMYRQQMQNLRLTSSQTFLLVRLVGNLKGSQVIKLFDEMDLDNAMENSDESSELVNKKSLGI
jgi:hypothetical protein